MDPPLSRRPWWRRIRLSVMALMVLVLVVGGVLGWFIRRAAIQRDAVKAIIAAGGNVRYDFQQNTGPPSPNSPPAPPGPKWLVDRLGIDFFANVNLVTFKTPQTDDILAHLGRLHRLERLIASSTPITDAGMAKVSDTTFIQLARLTSLEELAFGGEAGSDAGLAHLKALPNLEALQLHGPWLTDAGLAPVSEMDRLATFFVSDETSVTADGLNRLQQQRPTLRIGVNGTGRVDRARLDNLRSAVGPGAIKAGSQQVKARPPGDRGAPGPSGSDRVPHPGHSE